MDMWVRTGGAVALLGEDGDAGIEALVESPCADYGLPREQSAALVASRFASTDEVARLFAWRFCAPRPAG